MKEFTINKLRHLWLFLLLSVVSTAFAQMSVTTKEELLSRFGESGSYSLATNITLEGNEQLVVPDGKTVTLDLNGKTISHSGSYVNTGVIRVHYGGTLTINDSQGGGTIDGNTARGAGILLGYMDSGEATGKVAKLIVNAGIIKGDSYGISGNGSPQWTGTTDVTINGGTIMSTSTDAVNNKVGVGIYQPQVGKLTINGGYIESPGSAVEVRSGEVTISGDAFLKSTAEEYSVSPNSNGTTTIGAALSVAQHTTNNTIAVTVNGGTFTGAKAVSISNPQNNTTDVVAVEINAATLNGDVAISDTRVNPVEVLAGDEIVYNGKLTAEVTETPTYNFGAVVAPTFSVEYNGRTIQDYTVAYYDSEGEEVESTTSTNQTNGVINAGNYTAVISAESSVYNVPFTVSKYTLTADNTTITDKKFSYNKAEQKPNFDTANGGDCTVTVNNGQLTWGTDFEAVFPEDGDYTSANAAIPYQIKGKGNFDGTVNDTYQIYARQIKQSQITPSNATLTYDGSVQRPELTFANGVIFSNDDLVIAAAEGYDNTSAGSQKFQITTENPNFKTTYQNESGADVAGPLVYEYTISPKSIEGAVVDYDTELTYDGVENKPTIHSVKLDETPLTGDDYNVTWPDNTNGAYKNIGNWNFKIAGKGNYTGEVTKSYQIISAEENEIEVTYTAPTTLVYNGTKQTPKASSIVLKDKNRVVNAETNELYTLEQGTDYKVEFENSINAGTYNVTITGLGQYAEVTFAPRTYTIAKRDIATLASTTQSGSFVYAEGVKHPTEDDFTLALDKCVISEDDYDVTRSGDGTNVGTHSITYTAKESSTNYTGSVTYNFNIAQYGITINAAQLYKTYGQADTEAVTSLGQKANYVDFTIDENSGIKTLSAAEKAHILQYLEFHRAEGDTGEDYGDHKYMITTKADMSGCNYAITIQHNTSVLFIRKAPLTVHVAQNTKVYGTQDPDFTANKTNGNYISDYFRIYDANGAVVTKDYVDNSQDLKDVLNISRNSGEDIGNYAFTWNNDNYDVTFDPANFTITSTPAPDGITVQVYAQTYDGTAKTPAPWFVSYNGTRLYQGVDYEVVSNSYYDNINANYSAGDGTNNPRLTLRFIKNFSGTKVYPFTINKRDLTITAKSYALTTGDADPAKFELEYIGLANRDKDANNQPILSPNYPKFQAPTVTKVETTYDGIYKLHVNNDYIADNYNVTLVDGALTFGQGILTITADNKSKTYGTADPELTVTITGYPSLPSETELNRLLKPAGEYAYEISREAGEDVVDGGYTINVAAPTAVLGYAIVTVPGKLTINKANLTITTNNQTKVYGEPDPDFTVTVTGLVQNADLDINDTEESVLTYTWTEPEYNQWGWQTGTVTRSALVYDVYCVGENNPHSENVGKYDINAVVNQEVQNYNILIGNPVGKLEITKRPIIIKATDLEKYYGEVDPELAVDIEAESEGRGLKVWKTESGQHWVWYGLWGEFVTDYEYTSDVINAAAYQLGARERSQETRNGEDVREGGYNIPITRQDLRWVGGQWIDYNPNYDITYQNGTLTIKKCVLNVTAKDQGIEYGKAINSTYVTLANGTKNYAYTWAVDPITDEEGNVIGQKGYMENANVYVEDYYTNNPRTYHHASLNDKIEDIISLKTAVSKVGVHKPAENPYAYELTELGEKNYQINFTQGYLTISPLKTIPLNDAELAEMLDEPRTLTQVLDDHQGATVNVVLNKDRQFRKDQWYTLVLPFDIRVRDLSSALGYAVADTMDLKNAKEANLKLDITVGTIKANTPFIVKVDETIPAGHKPAQNAQADLYMGDVVFEGKTIAEFEYLANDGVVSVADQGGNTFYGTYAGKDNVLTTEYAIAEGPDYPVIVNGKDARGQFYQGYSNRTWPLFQTEAYWIPTEGSSAPVRIAIQEPDGTYTAISGVSADTLESEAGNAGAYGEGWYTISGVKLNAKPAVKGTYIFNGKKVLVK